MKTTVVFSLSLSLFLLFPVSAYPAQGGLPKKLEKVIQDSGFDRKGIGLFIQNVDASRPLVAFQADSPFNPASVIKLFTTAASLGILGSGYRWSTDVYRTGSIKRGTLDGQLYFRGNGDPYLTPERFWRLLNQISIFGIKNLSGNVVVDNSYFQPPTIDYGAFDDQPYRSYNVGPNAVLVGFQATEFHFAVVNNGAKPSINVTPFPQSPKMHIVNGIKLVNGGCGAWQKRLSLNTRLEEGVLQVEFKGRYARNCGRRVMYRRVTGARDHFQHFFLPLWQQLGGTFNGKVVQGDLPENATLILKEPSISLAEAVRLINKYSNNVMTRQVLLTLGAHEFGPPGTVEKGIAAIKAWMKEQHIDGPELQLDNGAGLSRDTRVSAAHLGRLLSYVYKQAYMPEFIASLPVSGYDGTMRHRFNDEPLMGHTHIKTGLLDFVQSMAGYVTTASGKRFIVVLLQNHPRAHTKAGERLQNDIIRWTFEL